MYEKARVAANSQLHSSECGVKLGAPRSARARRLGRFRFKRRKDCRHARLSLVGSVSPYTLPPDKPGVESGLVWSKYSQFRGNGKLSRAQDSSAGNLCADHAHRLARIG